MKILSKGEAKKSNKGYFVPAATVDCEGKPINIEDFLRAHGIPPKTPVWIERITGINPDFDMANICLFGYQ